MYVFLFYFIYIFLILQKPLLQMHNFQCFGGVNFVISSQIGDDPPEEEDSIKFWQFFNIKFWLNFWLLRKAQKAL
jgi:hypothetical protein